MQVHRVRTRADLRAFLRLPDWDPRVASHGVPLWHSTIRRWWTGKGPHRAHGPVELYLARDHTGAVRGRTTLHTDVRLDAKLGEATLLMGATEFADREALAAMVGYAVGQARSRGRTALLGPVSLLPNQVGGVITAGFDEPGFVDGPWNPEHYPADWEALGFERTWTGATWRCEDVARLDPDSVFPLLPSDEALVVRRGDRRHLAEQLPILRGMLNASFAELGYYTPIEADELEAATDGLAHLLDERLLLWLERDGQPVAFVLVVPDLTGFVRSRRGRMSPVDLVALMATRGRYRRDAVLIIKGTVPAARGQGLMRRLSHELLVGLRAGGYRNLSVTFIEDGNSGSQSQFVAMGGRPLHATCFYTRPVGLADDDVTEGGKTSLATRDDLSEGGDASAVTRLLARGADWGRAPSAHNTQPWRLRPVDARTLALGWHADRELRVGDPTRRDLLLSLGSLALALKVVAQDLGLSADVSWSVDESRHEAAVVRLREVSSNGEVANPAEGWTVADLQSRRTSRAPFLRQPGDEDVQGLAAEAGVELVLLPDNLIDRLLPAATARTLTGPAAEELRSWLRLTPTHARHDLDGLSAEALGLSPTQAAGLQLLTGSPRLRRLLGASRLDRVVAAVSAVRPRGTVVALCAEPGLELEQLGLLGERLLASWLAGQRAGWSAHPLSELIDDPRTAEALHTHVSLAGGRPRQVYALWRWGAPGVVPPRSPRLRD